MSIKELPSGDRATRADEEVEGEASNHKEMRGVILPQESNASVVVCPVQMLHRWVSESKPERPSRTAGRIPAVANRRHRPIEQVWAILVRPCLQAPCADGNRCDAHGIRAP